MSTRRLLLALFCFEAICYLSMWYLFPEKAGHIASCVMTVAK